MLVMGDWELRISNNGLVEQQRNVHVISLYLFTIYNASQIKFLSNIVTESTLIKALISSNLHI